MDEVQWNLEIKREVLQCIVDKTNNSLGSIDEMLASAIADRVIARILAISKKERDAAQWDITNALREAIPEIIKSKPANQYITEAQQQIIIACAKNSADDFSKVMVETIPNWIPLPPTWKYR